MPTYISLLQLTQKGVEALNESPNRAEAGRRMIQSMGGELKSFYSVLGRYDAVLIIEAPDDEIAMKISMANGRMGYSRAETLRAFSEDEYRQMISSLPERP